MLPHENSPISSLGRFTARVESGITWVLVAIIGTVCLCYSVWFNHFGFLHSELWTYVPYHLGAGSIFRKIFDSRTLDFGFYQGRELSYLFDHIDVMVMAESVRLGFPCFISVLHILFSVLIGFMVWNLCAHEPGLGRLTGLLLALLFWTAPFVFIHSIYRSAKVGAAFFLVWLAIDLIRARAAGEGAPQAGRLRRWFPRIFAIALTATLFDRQGVYLVGLLMLVNAFVALSERDRPGLALSGAMFLAIAVNAAYLIFAAPALTYAFFGYRPDFSLNKLPLGLLWANLPHYFDGALGLLVDSFRFLLGSVPAVAAVAMILGLLVSAALIDGRLQRGSPAKAPRPRRYLPVTLMTIGLLSGMYALMYLSHPPVAWNDVRRIYYWIPSGALTVVGLALLLGAAVETGVIQRIILQAILCLLLVGNVCALPAHRHVVEAGHLRDYLLLGPRLREALEHINDPAYQVPADVASNRAYQALRDYGLK